MNLFRNGSFYVYEELKFNVEFNQVLTRLKEKGLQTKAKDLVIACKPFNYFM